jgi:hypothetical protein
MIFCILGYAGVSAATMKMGNRFSLAKGRLGVFGVFDFRNYAMRHALCAALSSN